MKVMIDKEEHTVVYIDYQGNIPHSVETKFFVKKATCGPYWRFVSWDFFANNGNEDEIRAYEAGSGPGDEINAPNWIDGANGRYWADESVKILGKVKNGKRLKNPKIIKGYFENSRNPFKVAEITFRQEYCERCGHYSIEICDEHIYDDDDGELRYKDDDSYVE